MKPGKARHRITFLKPPIETDFSSKNDISKYTVHCTVWAELETLKGRRLYEAAKTHLESSRQFKIRFRNDLTNDMKVKYKNTVYEIAVPLENVDGMNEEMLVIVKAVE